MGGCPSLKVRRLAEDCVRQRCAGNVANFIQLIISQRIAGPLQTRLSGILVGKACIRTQLAESDDFVLVQHESRISDDSHPDSSSARSDSGFST